MSDLMRHVRALSEEIGPRGSTGPGEAAAAAYIAGAMRSFTHQVWTEPFRSFSSFSWPWGLIMGGCTTGALLLWWSPSFGLVLTALFAVLFLLQTLGRIELGLLFSLRPSQNVIGIVPPAGVVRGRLVLVAHYDSAKTAFNFSPGQVPYFRVSFLVITASILILPALGLLTLAFPAVEWARWVAVLPTLYLFGSLLTIVDREWRGRYTRGANDNASGVAAMLGLGEEFSERPLDHTEVWCVATGCEEVGMMGARAFLDKHGHMLKDAHFIILDNHGAGRVKYTVGEGMLRVLPSDPLLVQIARDVAQRHPEWGVTATCHLMMPTDATPVLGRGFKAIALLAFDENGLLPNWHWHTDVVENIDPRCLDVAAGFVREMARAIDVHVVDA